jgi:hypothetical protein
MGQGTYVVFVIAILDIVNINYFHSTNIEIMIEAAFLFFMLWILLGAFLVYQAQG